jgi:hypothetical protein
MRQLGPQVLMALAGIAALGASARAADPVSPAQLAEARTFLDQYTALSRSQAPEFYGLYSDRATIHARVQGQMNEVAFSGQSYKAWGQQLLVAHRIAIDISEFHGATVEQRGNRTIIRAKRLALDRCFWDVNYQLTLRRELGFLRIVDERFATDRNSACPPVQEKSSSVVGEDALLGQIPAQRGWRPMSREEIAQMALRLAEEAAAKRRGSMQLPQPALASVEVRASSTVTGDPDPVLITPVER